MFIWFCLAGLLGGVLGGMGMGGGTILIPILTMFLNVSQHTAQAINLISFIPTGSVALIFHLKNKLVQKNGLLYIIIPAIIISIIASLVAVNIEGEVLKKIFGGVLLLLSVQQIFQDRIIEFIKFKKISKKNN